MNAIIICVFNQIKYLEMCFLLLESIDLYSSIGKKFDLIVYTSTLFKDKIIEKFGDKPWLVFEINDNYNDINTSCKARMDVFEFSCCPRYEKFLYLDTDVLVKGDVNTVFDLCKKDVIYASYEGSIIEDTIFSRKFNGTGLMTPEEVEKFTGTKTFITGVMLFNNSDTIRELFLRIKEDMIGRNQFFPAYDQPYIIYNALISNLYDNVVLNDYVINRDFDVTSKYIIHHFPQGTGCPGERLEWMSKFLEDYRLYIKNK